MINKIQNKCNYNGAQPCTTWTILRFMLLVVDFKLPTHSCLTFSSLFSENAELENTIQLIKALSEAGILFTSEVCVHICCVR